MKKRIIPLLSVFLSITMLAGCASSSTADSPASPQTGGGAYSPSVNRSTSYGVMDDYDYDYGYEYEVAVAEEAMDMAYYGEATSSSYVNANTQLKIIYNVDLHMQTTDFDQGTELVASTVSEVNGYIQNSYIEGNDMYNDRQRRYASFTVRIPTDRLEDYVASMKELFNVTREEQYTSDISGQYYDTQSRISSLKLQEERLLSMLEGAEELQYMLEVERELANVRYEIETLTSAMNRMNNSVDYATVSVYLSEVYEYEDALEPAFTFGDRIQRAFTDSWKNFVIFCQGFVIVVIALLPAIIVALVVAAIIIIMHRRRKKNRPSGGNDAQRPPILSNLQDNAPNADDLAKDEENNPEK